MAIRDYERWSEAEEAKLLEMKRKGVKIEIMMFRLGRKRGAIDARLKRIAYSWAEKQGWRFDLTL